MDNLNLDQNLTSSILDGLMQGALAMSYWEVLAALLSVAYLVLAMRQNSLCWYAGFASTAILSWLFWDASLLMESALNIYYLAMAIYGWYMWNYGNSKKTSTNSQLPITAWSIKQHIMAIIGVVLCSFLSGYLLTQNTSAALPYLDSFTTWGAVLTTYMVAKKILENWIYWIVIDLLAAYMYADRGLYVLSLQMLIFVFMCFFGFKTWLTAYRQQSQRSSSPAVAA